MEVVAVIPARKGSVGVPRKNTRIVAGLPLWKWTAKAAEESEVVNRIIVTSDDSVILSDAKTHGIETVVRPPELASDDATLDSAILHALQARKAHEAIVVVLQPTVPVRRRGLIDDCVEAFVDDGRARSLLTASPLHFVWNEEGVQLNEPRVNRQAMRQRLQHEDGSVFVVRASDYSRHGKRVVVPVKLFENDWSPDIDTEQDLAIAEFLLSAASLCTPVPEELLRALIRLRRDRFTGKVVLNVSRGAVRSLEELYVTRVEVDAS